MLEVLGLEFGEATAEVGALDLVTALASLGDGIDPNEILASLLTGAITPSELLAGLLAAGLAPGRAAPDAAWRRPDPAAVHGGRRHGRPERHRRHPGPHRHSRTWRPC